MSLSITDAIPGAYVEQFFTDDEKGRIVRAPRKRRGYITNVKYPGDSPYDSGSVQAVFVKFEADRDPEPVKMAHLNLVRKADEGSLQRLKSDGENAAYDAYNLDIHKSPVADRREPLVMADPEKAPSSDKTGIFRTTRMSPQEAKKL